MRPGEPLVTVGRLVELTRDEAREIKVRSAELYRLTTHQRPGWFAAYVQHHTAVSRLIRAAVGRSHAS